MAIPEARDAGAKTINDSRSERGGTMTIERRLLRQRQIVSKLAAQLRFEMLVLQRLEERARSDRALPVAGDVMNSLAAVHEAALWRHLAGVLDPRLSDDEAAGGVEGDRGGVGDVQRADGAGNLKPREK